MNGKYLAYGAMIATFLISSLLMPQIIKYFRAKQLGQTTRDEGPKWHQTKSGTPTMGGVVIIVATVIVGVLGLIFFPKDRWYLSLILSTFLFFGGIGFIDDYIILIKKQNEGLTSRQKFLAQVVGGLFVFLMLMFLRQPTILNLPFIHWQLPTFIYGFLVVFWVVGFSNATNLTDGIDGLMASNGAIAYMAYSAIAATQERYDLMFFSLSVVGALLGFYLYNKKPAQIFMGDVGSLALGAGLAVLSILLFAEWTLLFIGFIYVIETASVMLQVAYFKKTGQRLFKMTPIHHHFEMSGWSEQQIVTRFDLVTLVAAAIAIWGMLV